MCVFLSRLGIIAVSNRENCVDYVPVWVGGFLTELFLFQEEQWLLQYEVNSVEPCFPQVVGS